MFLLPFLSHERGRRRKSMDFKILAVLALAAALESGGDALVRWGMKSGRILGFLLGAAVLFLYGLTVNLPKWDFGRLLGVYITLFFVISQVLSVFVFKETIPPERWWGGALVVAGGLCMTLGK
jgi:small multidrug resistance family-3 protein